jgi:hypothetical protein
MKFLQQYSTVERGNSHTENSQKTFASWAPPTNFEVQKQHNLCWDMARRQTFCVPKEFPNPALASDQVHTPAQQLDRLEITLRKLLQRGFKLMLMHPLPEPGNYGNEKDRLNLRALNKTLFANAGWCNDI